MTTTRRPKTNGQHITKKQSELLYADSEVTYLFGMDGGKIVIDGFGMAAFVNHPCDPNCETDQIAGRIWIIAAENIKPGKELTYDYNLYDATHGEEAPCYCGGKECRGTMFSEEEIARLKRRSRRKHKKQKRTAA